jgi:hypothetical protein
MASAMIASGSANSKARPVRGRISVFVDSTRLWEMACSRVASMACRSRTVRPGSGAGGKARAGAARRRASGRAPRGRPAGRRAEGPPGRRARSRRGAGRRSSRAPVDPGAHPGGGPAPCHPPLDPGPRPLTPCREAAGPRPGAGRGAGGGSASGSTTARHPFHRARCHAVVGRVFLWPPCAWHNRWSWNHHSATGRRREVLPLSTAGEGGMPRGRNEDRRARQSSGAARRLGPRGDDAGVASGSRAVGVS